ncbi:hypothetical protein QR680_016597 [Steinernema hermaphroditum]|uniref:ubiquitinyl hydrolase 1 n=1 Tax=Steinernema hermaphroditum TaxID=289476 RepID=A0AA39LMP8_9BILA|nr:hypothetical protein QR680_016597 [Steinernema hermaphroditum]
MTAPDNTGLPHIKGLRNLGLTCYYNSVMQCMMHTHLMHDYIRVVVNQDGWTAPRQNNFKLDDRDPFTLPKRRFEYNKDVFRGFVFSRLKQFFYEFHSGHSISPSELLNAIRESYKKTVLPHWTQCDASEAFMLLTECLETEERGIRKVAVKKHEFTHFKKVPIEDAIKAYQRVADQANVPTWIDAVFGLIYIQMTTCQDPACKHVSMRLVSTKNLILHLNFKPQEAGRSGSRFEKSSASECQMSKYKQKKLKEKKKRELRRVHKNTGPSLENGHSEHQEPVEKEDKTDEVLADPCEATDENGNPEDSAKGSDENTTTAPEQDKGLRSRETSVTEPEHSDSDNEVDDEGENKEELPADDMANGNAPTSSVATLVPYKRTSYGGMTIMDCLENWTAPNELSSYQCDGCCPEKSKKRVDAVQRFLIFAPPPVLVLCLQRATVRHTKVSTHVKFDLVIDIAPFCVSNGLRVPKGQKELKYGLYGIVVHEGYSSSAGHYIACVRRRRPPPNIRARFEEAFSTASVQPEIIKNLMEEARKSSEAEEGAKQEPTETDQWYYVSDNHYSPVSWNDVARRQAFMLFYERLD